MDELLKTLEQQLDFKDLSGTFSMTDVIIVLLLSTVLTALVAYVYKMTHKGTSYTQSYVHTLILMGIITGVIMMIVGSNIARAFALVGALSIIRFRNAVKETRDVGFLFLAMAIGMATGTKFYLLALIATVFICLIILILNRFDLFKQKTISQILKIELPHDIDFESLFDKLFIKHTKVADLISVDSVRSGTATELIYNIVPKKKMNAKEFISGIRELNGNNKVTLVTGYDNTDL